MSNRPNGLRLFTAENLFRLSVEGFRQMQRREYARADDSLARASALNPADPVTRYRRALLLKARGRDADALAEFERVVATRPVPPPSVLAASYVEAGRLLEASGHRVRAIEMYSLASGVRGAETAAREAARQGLDRLRGAPPPRTNTTIAPR